MTLHYIWNKRGWRERGRERERERERRCVREEWCELHRETRKARNGKRRGEDWGVVALHRPINQHHSKGLGLSSYACTHTRNCFPLLLNVPL